ncbi:hypothetical protein Cgig2_014139 [Carnegiea gigantea]|uniref:Ubiquitin-like domain-containing protein n=1 Tax=Carnegiea gigantea TaxID=171969 RepID=A0A9Q1GIT1_9CARY|nr:hypothetical protein Cgig2_014139 [Carnegiea gigantea]
MASSSSSSPTMDVKIETEDQNTFTLRIGQNDTVYAVKARICKTTGTPVFHQILRFNGRTLDNSFYIHTYEITHNSRLSLCIQDPLADLGGFPAPPIKAELLLNVAKHPEPFLNLSVYISETVLQLKQKVLQHCQGEFLLSLFFSFLYTITNFMF